MSTPSLIEWVPESGGDARPFPFADALKSSGDLWPEIAVEELGGSPEQQATELPLGHLVRHVISVTMRPQEIELCWQGGPTFSGIIDPGTVTIFPAFQPYTANWPRLSQGGLGIALQLSLPFAVAAVSHDVEHSADLEPIFARNDPFLAHAIIALHNLARDSGPNSRICGETLGLAMAARIVHQYGAQPMRRRPEPAVPLHPSVLRRIDEFIAKRIDDTLSVADLAALVGMSAFRFSRLFKLATGLAPHQYVIHRRLGRAKSMLAGGCSSIADVALLCGFASQSHFSGVFRRSVGMTPRQFRHRFK